MWSGAHRNTLFITLCRCTLSGMPAMARVLTTDIIYMCCYCQSTQARYFRTSPVYLHAWQSLKSWHCELSLNPEFLLKTVAHLGWDLKQSPWAAPKRILLREVTMMWNCLPSHKNMAHGFSRPRWHLLAKVGWWHRCNIHFGDLWKPECLFLDVFSCGACPAALQVSTADFSEWQPKAFETGRKYLNTVRNNR